LASVVESSPSYPGIDLLFWSFILTYY
jgi:hypothetical protein